MRSYESILVLDGALTQEAVAALMENAVKVFEKNGAVDVEITDWGKRTVAYPLQKKSLGHYQHLTFRTGNMELIKNATAELLLNEAVLKMQSHRLETASRKFQGNPRAIERAEEEASASA